MIELGTIRRILEYSDWSNEQVLTAAARLGDAQLDQAFDMGPGSLRKTLIHIYNGEAVWLERWKQREPRWPSESEPTSVSSLADQFAALYRDRDAFLGTLPSGQLAREQVYRDSKGSRFAATLGDMLMQGCNHSIHHRAQAVNMIRRLGGGLVELDYMMRIRKPVAG